MTNVSEVPIPANIVGWNYGSYGIWALVLIQAVFFAGVVVRNGPKWLESWAAKRRMGLEDDRVDADRHAAREDAIERRLQLAEKRLVYLTGALAIMLNGANADDAATKQALAMLDMADGLDTTDEFSVAMRKMLKQVRDPK